MSALFLVGLVDRRRLVSLHTLDLLALLSFGFSLWFFNRGEVFRSAPLAVPPLAYLLVRTGLDRISRPGADTRARPGPCGRSRAIAVFVGGFRVGLNTQSSGGVIDVGYAGVIGADRIIHGQAPYGHMPVEDGLAACGRADSDGEIRDRIQAERPLRIGQRARRHVRARRLPRVRPRLSSGSAGPGSGTRCPLPT